MAVLEIKKFSHVALNVSEIKQSTAFYQNVLGLQVIFETELAGGIGFSSGCVTPAVFNTLTSDPAQRVHFANMFLWGPGFFTSSTFMMATIVSRIVNHLFPSKSEHY